MISRSIGEVLALLSECDFGGDAVEVLEALLRDDPRVHLQLVVLAVLLDDLKLLQLLQRPPDHLAATVEVVGSAGADLLLGAVDVSEQGDACPGTHVDLPGEGGHSGVEPVVVEGSEVAC